jgi:hypothetical protein
MNAPGLANQVPPAQPSHSWIDKLATVAAYLYLRRVPILIGAFIFVLPFLALWSKSPVTSLFQNLFRLGTAGAFWCAMAAAVLSWSLLLTGRVVLLNGKERFNRPQLMVADDLTGRSLLTVLIVALPLILGPFTQRNDFKYTTGDLVAHGLSALAGVAAAYALAFLALFVAVLGAAKGTQAAAVTFPGPRFLRDWLAWADQHGGLAEDLRLKIGTWVRQRLPKTLWEGYLDSKGFLWSGHWLVLVFFILTLVLYKVVDVYAEAHLGGRYAVPALTFVILLLINLNWLFSGLAFFLDRYRIPLLIPVLAFCLVSGALFPSLSDHYYTTAPATTPPAPVTPAQVVEERMKQKRPIVVIVTAGGGIQSAAWTAQVMQGLEEQTKDWKTTTFSDSVTLMSGVSGGANGAMFYLNLFHPGKSPAFDGKGLENLVNTASEDSLDSVAWALVYRDIPRILFPYMNISERAKLRDRGYMLEQAWRKHGNVQGNLSEWREGVAAGLRPAAIFNSTIDETGEPLVLANTDMKDTAPDSPGLCNTAKETTADRRSFHGLYPKTDLPVVTAVRLASTFPYVTPAARALSPCPEYHMIDGGYYDNYGVSSAIAWLEEAFTELQKQNKALPDDVLFVQIRSFPDDALAEPASKGWFFQSYAPVEGLLSVRTTAQLVRDREELEMFAERWRKSPEAGRKYARIHFAGFEFLGKNPPLSWSMNPRQKAEIGDQWKDPKISGGTDMQEVRCLFQPTSGCNALPDKGPW